MGVVFVVAWMLEPAHPWLGYVRATAEAGLVGGVADWFAITALFRRPLNLPIPHTAIIPSRKDRIGRSLGNFVQNNFLSPEVLGGKLRAAAAEPPRGRVAQGPRARPAGRPPGGGRAPERHRRRPRRRRARASSSAA